MAEYLLLLREEDVDLSQHTPAQFQEYFGQFVTWAKRLEAEGRLRGVAPLTKDGGKTVRKRGRELIVDGPYSEAKEAVVGYFIVSADSYEAAAAIAKGCPCALAGGTVEIRELAAFPLPRAVT